MLVAQTALKVVEAQTVPLGILEAPILPGTQLELAVESAAAAVESAAVEPAAVAAAQIAEAGML